MQRHYALLAFALLSVGRLAAQIGSSCATALPVALGTYTAPSDNYWYVYVPEETTLHHVQTCGMAACDTKIWIYDHCTGLVFNETALNTVGYDDDGCGSQNLSIVDLLMMAGQSYYIRIGDYQDNCAGTPVMWKITADEVQPPPTCPDGQVLAELMIVPDGFPQEITWDLATGDGTTLASGNYLGGYACVDTGACLVLTMHDGYGDGILAPGGYTLLLDGAVIAQGGAYGYTDRVEFNCPPGFSCGNPLSITEGEHTAPEVNTWYSFTPAQNGYYTISTCGTNTCDTRIWVYDHCQGLLISETNEATIYYGDNECGLQSNIGSAMLGAGETYWIRIGDTGTACEGSAINWSLGYNGPISGCTSPTACNYNPFASIDDGSCLQPGDPDCPNGPDLTVVQADLASSISVETMVVNPTDCYIGEGCLQGFGTREIIRFDTHIKNIGTTDYYIGSPASSPGQFTFGNCHNHWHYKGYAEYVLYGSNGQEVVNGFKNGFCVLDLECEDGGSGQYGCNNMGISAGCGDIYSSGLDCQWIDITGVPDGIYTLVVRCNWDNDPDALGHYETDLMNNWAQVCVNISHTPNFHVTLDPNCSPYVDCAGEIYGSAQLDCEGVCQGTRLIGDLDVNGLQDYADAQDYINAIIGDDIAALPCNDANGDGDITVTDVALVANCRLWNLAFEDPDSVGTHDHCNFPKPEVINIFDTVVFAISDVDIVQGYIDIAMRNPNKEIVGYELLMSGIEITGVDNLVDPAVYPVTPNFTFGGHHILTTSFVDSSITRSNVFRPLCRVHFMQHDDMICIQEVMDVVNENYVNSLTFLEENCVVGTGIMTSTAVDMGVQASPNPFHDATTLRFPQGHGEKATVQLLDLQGRTVRTWTGISGGRLRIERGDLAVGTYGYRITGPVSAGGRLVVQ